MGGPTQINPNNVQMYDGIQYQATKYLSIEELVAFCAHKMDETDTEIRGLMSKQNDSIDNGKALAEAENALNKCNAAFTASTRNGLDGGSSVMDNCKDDAALYTTVCDTYNALVDASSHATGEAKAAIEAKLTEMKKRFGEDTKFDNGKIAKVVDGDNTEVYTGTLKAGQDGTFAKGDFGKGGGIGPDNLSTLRDTCQNEQSLNMIQVQSAVSKREQSIQLVTNLVQKMSAMAESVIQNIGK